MAEERTSSHRPKRTLALPYQLVWNVALTRRWSCRTDRSVSAGPCTG